MILLADDAALRREELMSLRVDDFDWARGLLTIRPEMVQPLSMVDNSALSPTSLTISGEPVYPC